MYHSHVKMNSSEQTPRPVLHTHYSKWHHAVAQVIQKAEAITSLSSTLLSPPPSPVNQPRQYFSSRPCLSTASMTVHSVQPPTQLLSATNWLPHLLRSLEGTLPSLLPLLHQPEAAKIYTGQCHFSISTQQWFPTAVWIKYTPFCSQDGQVTWTLPTSPALSHPALPCLLQTPTPSSF